MKLFLLAAAAVIATPALAQTSGSVGTSTPTSNGGQGTPTDTRNNATDSMNAPSQTTTTDAPSTQPMANQPMSNQPMSNQPMASSGAAASGDDPVGGYQPAAPAMSGPMQPGATVTFQPAQSPDQAYPAPAPMAKYPVCKKGEFDNCMQGRNSTHSREVRGRRRS